MFKIGKILQSFKGTNKLVANGQTDRNNMVLKKKFDQAIVGPYPEAMNLI